MINLIKSKISQLLQKAIMTESAKLKTEDTLQSVAIKYADVVSSDVLRPQNYGFYSNPMEGAQAFIAFPNGNSEDGVCIIAAHNEYAPKEDELPKGAVGVFQYKGHKIVLTDTGIEIIGTEPITLKSKNVDIVLESGGKFTVGTGTGTPHLEVSA